MSSWARPGVKCVCVNDEWLPGKGGKDEFLREGEVYTVHSVYKNEIGVVGHEYMLRYISRFRPLITKTQEQDVELFRHLLVNAPEPVSP